MLPKPEKAKAPATGTRKGFLGEATQVLTQGFNMSNSTEVIANNATVTPDLTVVEGQITTTSQQIAEHFGKRHADVMRAIKRLECSAEFTERNFAQVITEFVNGKGGVQKAPAYRITRDGFVFLAMGFTGKEAAQWKEAYITAFNKMEAELLKKVTRPYDPVIDYDRISPAQAQDLKEIVEAIVKAEVQGFGETWARLHRKFKVNSYLQLPATRHLEARQYLIAKLPKGYDGTVVDEQPAPRMSLDDAVRLDMAFSMAARAGAQVQQSVFTAVMTGDTDWRTKRYVSSLHYDRIDNKLTSPATNVLDHNDMIVSLDTLPKWIDDGDALFASNAQLASIASACISRLTKRIQ